MTTDTNYLCKRNSIVVVSPVAAVQVFDSPFSLVQSPPCDGPRWWDVQVYAYGTETNVAAGTAAVVPTVSELKSAQRTAPLRARVMWEGHEVDMDIGAGMRASVFASNISIDVVAPAGSIHVRQGQAGLFNPAPVAPIQQQTSWLLGQIGYLDAPIGDRVAKLTDVVETTVGLTVNIPASARRVQVFQAGVAVPAPLNFQSNTLSAINLGQIDFQGTVPLSTVEMLIPGRATQIACPAQARVLTFVWQLEL